MPKLKKLIEIFHNRFMNNHDSKEQLSSVCYTLYTSSIGDKNNEEKSKHSI